MRRAFSVAAAGCSGELADLRAVISTGLRPMLVVFCW
jgi:hypothetical protein